MKLKTIFYEYEMPKGFWDKLEKIFEIESKESYERGLNASQETKFKYLIAKTSNSSPDINVAEKEPKRWHCLVCKEDVEGNEMCKCMRECKQSAESEPTIKDEIKQEIDKDYALSKKGVENEK